MRIGIVYYFVSNMNRALAFYREKLGLKCINLAPNHPHPWAELDAGDILLGLEEMPKKHRVHRPPWGGAIVSFQVNDIRKAKTDLENREVHFTTGILVLDKVKVTQFSDPDGNLLELHERL